MATFHLDLVNGNDANDGSDWANAWLTFASGPTAARTAPGDTIKVAKTDDDIDSGISATFTNNSAVVTLASPLTKTIENATTNTGWTASANITLSASTSRKIGSGALLITPAAGFTTGKMVYKGLGSAQDFSGYTKISLWFRNSATAAIPANQWKICLCSDTTGDTIVNSIYIPELTATGNGYMPITVDTGGALGASIQSVAIYADVDPGTTSILINNIIACNDFSLQSVFGKSGDVNYCARSIDGTALEIDSAASANSGRGYSGTTESVNMYYTNPFCTTLANPLTIAESGNATGGRITYSGGWNTSSNTVTGYTRICGGREGVNVLSNIRDFIKIENFKFFRYSSIFSATSGGAKGMIFDNIVVGNFSTGFSAAAVDSIEVRNSLFLNCTGSGILGTTSGNIVAYDCEIKNSSGGVYASPGSVFYNCYFRNNTVNFLVNGPLSKRGDTYSAFHKCTFFDGSYSVANTCSGIVWSFNEGGTANNHKGYSYDATINLQSSIVHDTEPYAYEVNVTTTNRTILSPVIFQLAQVAVTANNLVTVTVWVKKSHATNIVAAIKLPPSDMTLSGTSEETATKANDTNWEQLTLTFTPTESGVIPILAEAYYSAGSSSVYFGAITVTQA